MHPAFAILISYLIGSIPAAWLAGRAHGVDLTRHGSGNLGATNVVRVLGWKTGMAVFLVDVAKGALPVILLPALVASRLSPTVVAMAIGLAAVAGHVRPVLLGFRKGGKGVATATGVFLGIAPVATLVAFAVFVAVVVVSGYVSLGSLVSAVALTVTLGVVEGFRSEIFFLGGLLSVFVFWTHRANMGRLRRGEEHRFGRKARS
jgi:acyl phosphate:glycerol-3-phosphate acyltransferase